jgi:hypothetical protein
MEKYLEKCSILLFTKVFTFKISTDDSCYMYHLCKENVQFESRLLRDNAALKESKNQRNHIVEYRVQSATDTNRVLRRKVT